MEEKARSYRINWLPAVLFAVLPLIQLIRFIMLQLAYPDAWLPTFTGYLNILWAAAYILLAIALFSGKRNTLFAVAFSFPIGICLISLLLHHQRLSALFGLATYCALHIVILSGNARLRQQKATRFLGLLPALLAFADLAFQLFAGGASYSITRILALLAAGIWAMDPTAEMPPDATLPFRRQCGIGLILLGFLLLISHAVSLILKYIELERLSETLNSPLPHNNYTLQSLLCVIVSICAIYGGYLLSRKPITENG